MQNRLLLATGCGLIIIAIVGTLWWERYGSARERARSMAGLPLTAEVTPASVQAGLLRQLPPGTYEKDVLAYLAWYGISEDQLLDAGQNETMVQWSISISSSLPCNLTPQCAVPPLLDAPPVPVERGFYVTFVFVGNTNPAIPGSIEHTRLLSIDVK